MSIVLPSLPTAKSSGFVPAQSDNATLTQDWLAQLLASADIHLNGTRAWDIQINHPQMLKRLLKQITKWATPFTKPCSTPI